MNAVCKADSSRAYLMLLSLRLCNGLQVRAAALSGDCTLWSEFLRGNFGIQKQFQACVRRRANLSVQGNPHCKGEKCKAAVDLVMESCLADTAPFDRLP